MTVGNLYKVTKKIKLHTNPRVEAEIIKTGQFVRETSKYYVFDAFMMRKVNVIKIEEIEMTWDAETIMEFVERLEEHYPYSPSVCNTIDKIASRMLKEKKG